MIVDSHCHLDYDGLVDRLPEVLANAQGAGVGLMLSIGTRVSRFPALLQLAEAHPQVYCTVGTHPHHAHDELAVTTAELIRLAGHEKVVGIGEVGLDYHYEFSPKSDQEEGFRRHIAAARETGLPLVIHAREADQDMARILMEEMRQGAFKPLLHCFTASPELAWRNIGLGGYISFSGILTYKTAENLRQLAAELPMDRILVETDAPYLAPLPYRGKSNEPAYVVKTLEVLAAARKTSVADMAAITTANFFRLFDKIPVERQATFEKATFEKATFEQALT